MQNNIEQLLNKHNQSLVPPLGRGGGLSFFITGIGTDVGKTVASAIIAEALQADYWKPVQAGYEDGTDRQRVQSLVSNNASTFYEEAYMLQTPASPHIAARAEGIEISLDVIAQQYLAIQSKTLIIEGAGGLMVPLNDSEFIVDLIERLRVKVILVSRNYLGSINHSLATAAVCKQRGLDVAGWIFNGPCQPYEEEIARWSGYPKIASIPLAEEVNSTFVQEQAGKIKARLKIQG